MRIGILYGAAAAVEHMGHKFQNIFCCRGCKKLFRFVLAKGLVNSGDTLGNGHPRRLAVGVRINAHDLRPKGDTVG